jgi:hypothetical protein
MPAATAAEIDAGCRSGEPRRRARRRAGAVIGDADQDGVEQPPLAGRRQAREVQQDDRCR